MLTATGKFPSVFSQLLQYSRQRPSFSAYRAAPMTKTAFSSTFVVFAIQFCFRCKFSFHEKRHSSKVWQWRDFSRTNRDSFATHNNLWDCFIYIDNRSRQMPLFVSVRAGWAKAGFRVMLKDFEIKKLFLFKKNRFHVAVRLFRNRSQRTSKCGKSISDTIGYCLVSPFFCSYHILTSSVTYYWTDARQHEISLLYSCPATIWCS